GARLHGEGQLVGLIDGLDPRGAPRLAGDPLATVRGDGAMELHVENLHYAADEPDLELDAPEGAARTRLHATADRRGLHAELELGHAAIDLGDDHLELEGLRESLDAAFHGDPRAATGELSQRLQLARATQDLAPLYPIGDLVLAAHAVRGADGVVRV